MTQYIHESLRQVWRIVEWRDGCVYRTEPVGLEWREIGAPEQVGDLIYTSLSTSVLKDMMARGQRNLRTRKVEA